MPTRDAKFTYTPEEHDYLTFAWDGGPYIDIYSGEEEAPRENINVWDYESDVSIIAPDVEEFRARCDEWIDDNAA